jgi:hypothetical protein
MKTFRILIAMMLAITIVSGQEFNNAGSTGMQFLKIGTSARSGGMAGGGGSIAGDASYITMNPALIGTISEIALSVQHVPWAANTEINSAALVIPISGVVNLALSTTYLTSGSIEMTTIEMPEGTGHSYDVTDIAVGLSTSVRLTPQLSFATSIKYLQERIYDASTDGLALDAGMWYSTEYKSLNLGFSMSNVGFEQGFSGAPLEVQYNPNDPAEPLTRAELQTQKFGLPLSFRASGSFDVFEMFDEKSIDHILLTTVDFIQTADTRERLILAAEYGWSQMVFFRGGYAFNADELGWSGGLGALLNISSTSARFDAAVSSLGRFGTSYRIGISIYTR